MQRRILTLHVAGFTKKFDLINSRQEWQQTTLIKYKKIIFPLNYAFKSHHSTQCSCMFNENKNFNKFQIPLVNKV